MSELFCGNRKNQDLARSQSVIDSVINLMASNDGNQELRQWCLHTLFYILCDNEANQIEALRNPNFKKCVRQELKDDWKGWEYNEAQEIVAMMNLSI